MLNNSPLNSVNTSVKHILDTSCLMLDISCLLQTSLNIFKQKVSGILILLWIRDDTDKLHVQFLGFQPLAQLGTAQAVFRLGVQNINRWKVSVTVSP